MHRSWTALLVAGAILASAHPCADGPARRTPKLVVIVVVDQMRADYVEKFGSHWTGGFRRLMGEGAWFRQAAYPYLTTVTCAGHTTIVTGSFPRTHGIVGNAWWDRAAGKSVNCVSDPDQTLVSYGHPATGGTSTRNMRVPTLADELRVQAGVAPRIVTLSLKDRTATTMAGRRADVATWFDEAAESFVTSSAFAASPVPFVARFIAAHPIEAAFGTAWTKMLPETAYLYADDGLGEKPPAGWTATFPHPFKGRGGNTPDAAFYQQWDESPLSDAFLGQFAEAAIDEFKLGQGAGTDYLAVSFSALDIVGHDFGPRSHEIQDVLARLDVTLGALLAHLDRTVGREHYVLALTADHGVSPIPEQEAAAGVDAGRIRAHDLATRIDQALEPILGPGTYVAHLTYNDLYFAPGIFEKLQANPEAMHAALDAARSLPGVARVFRGDELTGVALADDPIRRAAQESYFPGRSGDFIVVPRPYFLATSDATTHASPYGFDQHVPMFLLGQGIARGQFETVTSPADIAPTLAFLCGITLPAADGRVLNEALTAFPAPGAAAAPPGTKR
jgi:predicted AlkP superfamily pyrophosphatase or phosphodiesterase